MRRRRPRPPAFSLFSFQDIITSVTGIMILITLMLALEAIRKVEASTGDSVDAAYERTEQAIAEIESELRSLGERLAQSQARTEKLPRMEAPEALAAIARLEVDSRRLESEIAAFENRTVSLGREREEGIEEAQERIAQAQKQIARLQQEMQEIGHRTAEAQARLESVQDGKRIFFERGVADQAIWILEIADRDDRLQCVAGEVGSDEAPKTFRSIFEINRWARGLEPSSNAFLIVLKPSGLAHYRKLEEMLSGADEEGLSFDVGVYLIAEDQSALEPATGGDAP